MRERIGAFDARSLCYQWRNPDPGMDGLCTAIQALIAEHVKYVIRGTTFPAGHPIAPGHIGYDIKGDTWIGPFEPTATPMTRVEELVATGAEVIGTACPFCQTMFRDALGTVTQAPPKLLDVAQIAAATLQSEPRPR